MGFISHQMYFNFGIQIGDNNNNMKNIEQLANLKLRFTFVVPHPHVIISHLLKACPIKKKQFCRLSHLVNKLGECVIWSKISWLKRKEAWLYLIKWVRTFKWSYLLKRKLIAIIDRVAPNLSIVIRDGFWKECSDPPGWLRRLVGSGSFFVGWCIYAAVYRYDLVLERWGVNCRRVWSRELCLEF